LQSAYVEHAPQTPATQACPLAQSEASVQEPHVSSMQPSPGSQSAEVEQLQVPFEHVAVTDEPHCAAEVQAPQTPSVHTWPLSQSLLALHEGVQIPEAHASPVAQSLLTEQVHSTVVCVATHEAFGPHCALDVHSSHVPPEQT
jgi:hypothetical protein